MELSWDDVRLFLAAWQAGSLSDAARALDVGQATMSRRLARLEQLLGHTLFDRTRAGLIPTEAGRTLHPHAVAMSAEAGAARAALEGLDQEPEGVVRLATAPGIATDLLPPLLPRLMKRAPRLVVELRSDNRALDVLARETDLAIRADGLSSDDVISRSLGSSTLGVWGAPRLVAALLADPSRPAPWIQWSPDMAHIPLARWVDGQLAGRPPAMRTNSFLVMRAAAVAGLGLMVLPGLQAKLVGLERLPLDVELPQGAFSLVMHPSLRRVPRVRAVADFVVEQMEALRDLGAFELDPPQAALDFLNVTH